jgi:hypothetical protein
MKRLDPVLIAGLTILFAALPSAAHHAFASEFDEARVVKFKGTVMLIVRKNPHGLIFVDAQNDSGVTDHWALETPSANQLDGIGLGIKGTLKVGDTVEACGFATKDGIDPMKSYQAPEPISLSLKSIPREISTGRLIWPEILTLPDGRKLALGQRKCGVQ